MKTTLIPPDITQGERKFLKIDGDRHLQIDGQTLICDMQYYPWVDLKDGDWKMIAAAPAMAEALLGLLEASGQSCTHPAWEAARNALLAAGYTESTDPIPQN